MCCLRTLIFIVQFFYNSLSPLNFIQHHCKRSSSLCFVMGFMAYTQSLSFFSLKKASKSLKSIAKLVLYYLALLLCISNLYFLKFALDTLTLSSLAFVIISFLDASITSEVHCLPLFFVHL